MPELTLDVAERIADEALAEGRRIGAAPLTVVVLDPGGHVKVAKRSDGSGILRVEIAHGKAYGALGMGLPGRALANRAAQNPTFFTALAAVSSGRMVPGPGGVLIRDAGGGFVGAGGL